MTATQTGIWVVTAAGCVVGSIVVIFILFLLTPKFWKYYITDRTKKQSKKRDAFGEWTALAVWMSAFGYLLFLVIGGIAIWTSSIPCTTSLRIISPIYQCCKGVMYIVFLSRLDIVFAGTTYAYNSSHLRIAEVIIAVLNLFIAVCDVIFPTSSSKGRRMGDFQSCKSAFPLWIPSIVILQDIVLSVACLHMFTKPLKHLIEEQKKNGAVELSSTVTTTGRPELASTASMSGSLSDRPSSRSPRASSPRRPTVEVERQGTFRRLITKLTILTWVAVISSFLMLTCLVLTGEAVLVPLDAVTNTMSMVLMSSSFDEYYDTWCFCPIWIAVQIGCDVEVKRTRAPGARRSALEIMTDATHSTLSIISAGEDAVEEVLPDFTSDISSHVASATEFTRKEVSTESSVE
jgi:hypothetical protein